MGNLIKVRALDPYLSAYTTAEGQTVMGRFVGRDRFTGEILEDGENVPDNAYFRRLIKRGEIVLLTE